MIGTGISTFPRFLYLNLYAILLAVIGITVVFIPVYKISWFCVIAQVIIVFVCIKGAYGIFSSWDDKKRKYIILCERNKDKIRYDTFSEYMSAPCGRLLAKIVLKDLGHSEEYKVLQKMREPFFKEIRKNCLPQKTVVYINRNGHIEKQMPS